MAVDSWKAFPWAFVNWDVPACSAVLSGAITLDIKLRLAGQRAPGFGQFLPIHTHRKHRERLRKVDIVSQKLMSPKCTFVRWIVELLKTDDNALSPATFKYPEPSPSTQILVTGIPAVVIDSDIENDDEKKSVYTAGGVQWMKLSPSDVTVAMKTLSTVAERVRSHVYSSPAAISRRIFSALYIARSEDGKGATAHHTQNVLLMLRFMGVFNIRLWCALSIS